MTYERDYCDYDSKASKDILSQIVAYLLGRPLNGATQKDIAAMLGLSKAGANRYINHLVARGKIHLWQPPKMTQKGYVAGIYMHGPLLRPYIKPGLEYTDIPLDFFPGRKK